MPIPYLQRSFTWCNCYQERWRE